MPNKLYYIEGKVWGLIGVPQKPIFDEIEGFLESSQKALFCYGEALESCKENKKEVVNPELVLFSVGSHWYHSAVDRSPAIQPGDIFAIPEGYEFKKEYNCPDCPITDCVSTLCPNTVLRLVKTEGKEEHRVTGPWDCQDEETLKAFYGECETLTEGKLEELWVEFQWGMAAPKDAADSMKTGFKEAIKWYAKHLSQPSPEESQTETCVIETNRWTKTRRIFPVIFTQQEAEDHIKKQSTENSTFELFTISRKRP